MPEYTLVAVNARLKASNTRVSIRQRGGALALVATLPPKPGSKRPMPFQQEVYLSIPASETGLKRAENEARLLGARLVNKEFDWRLYLRDEQLPEYRLASSVIAKFKAHYMQTHSLREATWKNHWWKVYKRLPQDEPLTLEQLIAVVDATERDSRNRMETCRKLQHLADFAEIKVNLLQFKDNYGPAKVQARQVPTDAEIEQYWQQIPNTAWRWVFGVLAAFGLRPHEAFFCEWDEDELHVIKGKTGDRVVFTAIYPEWVEQWNLKEIVRPKIDFEAAYDDQKLGAKITRQLRRYGVPFTSYDLRHAWALRASVTLGLPVTTSSALLGHNPTIHLKT